MLASKPIAASRPRDARTTSSVLRPILPVEPRMTTLRDVPLKHLQASHYASDNRRLNRWRGKSGGTVRSVHRGHNTKIRKDLGKQQHSRIPLAYPQA